MSEEDKGRNPQRGQISPEDREVIRQRSAEIGKKIEAVQAKKAVAGRNGRSQQSAFGQAFKYAAELVIGVVAGVLLGKFLDGQFGTDPWLLVLFLILGFAAGMLNVIRGAQKAQAENEALQRSAPSVPDDQDDD